MQRKVKQNFPVMLGTGFASALRGGSGGAPQVLAAVGLTL